MMVDVQREGRNLDTVVAEQLVYAGDLAGPRQ